MRAPLIVVTGTGTGVGKTHLSVALTRRWGRAKAVAAFKPFETGVDPRGVGPSDDAAHLEAASTFHVKHDDLGVRLRAPLSPHLAAEKDGVTLSLGRARDVIDSLRERADGVLVELAGGLFTPLTTRETNRELLALLEPTLTVLVAPDRLGVLHDVLAVVRAAADVRFAIVLSAPATADDASGTNARELGRLQPHPVYGPLPRRPSRELEDDAAVSATLENVTQA